MKRICFSVSALLLILILNSCSDDKYLREALPESVNISSERLNRIDTMLLQAIEDKWIAELSDL